MDTHRVKPSPTTASTGDLLDKLLEANMLEQEGDTSRARILYEEIIAQDPGGAYAPSAQKALEKMGIAPVATSALGLPELSPAREKPGESIPIPQRDPLWSQPAGWTQLQPQRQRFRVPFTNSIGSRLFLFVLGGALVGLSGMSYFFYTRLENLAGQQIQGTLNTKVRTIEGELGRAEASMGSLAAAVRTMKQLGIKDAASYRKLAFEFFQKRSNLTIAVGFGQTPYQVVPNREWYWPYFYQDQGVQGATGQLLPPPFDKIRYSELFADDKYPQQGYYKDPVAAKKGLWTEPYLFYGITMTTYANPFTDDEGNLVGVAATDVNVTGLGNQVKDSVTKDGGYFVVVSEQGKLLVYPPESDKAKNRVSYQEVPELAAIWPQVQGSSQGLIRAEGKFWAYQRVRGTNWLMLAAVPQEIVLGPVIRITVLTAIAAGVLLAVVVFLFVRQLNARLKPILDECNKLMRADSEKARKQGTAAQSGIGRDDPNADLAGLDELGVLSTSFSRMSQQLQESFEGLEARVDQRTQELKEAKDAADASKAALQQGAVNLLLEIEGARQGNLTVNAPVTDGVVGSIADAFNTTMRNLRTLVLEVRAVTNQVSDMAQSSAPSMQHLSDDAVEQAEELNRALLTVTQIADSIRSVAQSAQEAAAIAQQGAKTAQAGEEVMDLTVTSINNVQLAVAETAKKVDRLTEAFQQISQILSTINGISERTNLLAYNASIEASRAGENGQGFRVVAEEVRRLAQRVTDATKSIESIVEVIQQETAEVRLAMETGQAEVLSGTELVGKTKQTLQGLATISQEIDQYLQSISKSTQAQAQFSQEVNQVMEQAAIATQSTSEQATTVTGSLKDLVSVAKNLQTSVSQFRLEK